jgi:hypothetical protein
MSRAPHRPARRPLRRRRAARPRTSLPPLTTALGALLNHITGGHIVTIDEPARAPSSR